MASSIVVASGKGGVGKTSLAVNLGLTLARQGRRTVLLDADFGMANAHILIGANPQKFIMDALDGDASMSEVLCDAPHGMKFISGGTGLLEMLNLEKTKRYQAIRMVEELRDQTEVRSRTRRPAPPTARFPLSPLPIMSSSFWLASQQASSTPIR